MAADKAISAESGFMLMEALLFLLICSILVMLISGWTMQRFRYDQAVEGGWKNEEVYRLLEEAC